MAWQSQEGGAPHMGMVKKSLEEQGIGDGPGRWAGFRPDGVGGCSRQGYRGAPQNHVV